MEKVICDICGSEFPATDNQCPVCGCAKTVAPVVTDGNAADGQGSYVKGGRFSKSNVRRRNNGEQPKRVAAQYTPEEDDVEEEPQSNRGLIFVIIALLVAIIGVSTYIAVTFFGKTNTPTNPTQSSSTTKPSGERVPCGSIAMETVQVSLTKKGDTFQLVYSLIPANTTDVLAFTSSNEDVATVNSTGLVTAVGSGNTVIKVVCGDIASEIPVVCTFENDPSSQPSTQPTTKPNNLPQGDFIVPEDATIITPIKIRVTGTRVNMRKGPGTSYQKVHEAVTDDRFTIYATYTADGYNWGLTDKGWIARSFTVVVSESDNQPYLMKINNATPTFGDSSACEVSVGIGDSFLLTVVDQNGNNVSVSWTASKTGLVTISGNKVTRSASGIVVLTATHDGYEFKCTINNL